MVRIHVVVEGRTEEGFIKRLLGPFLQNQQVYLQPSIIGKPMAKGGDVRWSRLRDDLRRLLRDSNAYVTMFVDFYGLRSDMPGHPFKPGFPAAERKRACEDGITTRLREEGMAENALRRFIPYVQMHEFEALLFSDPEVLAESLNQPALARHLAAIRQQFRTPEEIDEGPQTAPSKRLLRHFPAYSKTVQGPLAAESMSLETIRRECPLFDTWVRHLEQIAAP